MVPICTIVAPAKRNSTTSLAVAIPPIPIIGIFTALNTLCTLAIAMGLIAGPDRPPKVVLSLGLRVFKSIAIPTTVLIALTASAPPDSAAWAISSIRVTLGLNFIMRSLSVLFRISIVSCSVISQFTPNSIPPSFTFGQEILISYPTCFPFLDSSISMVSR